MTETMVSVVVPVYGTADYIDRCARSLFAQTMAEGIEFIFVDDATPDSAVDVLIAALGDHPERAAQVRILHHEQNRGPGAAYNTGIRSATGRYVAFLDSDDWVLERMYADLTEMAETSEADLLSCDMVMAYEGHGSLGRGLNGGSAEENIRRLLIGRLSACPGNKLVRRQFLTERGIYFDESVRDWTDLDFTSRLVAASTAPLYVPRHYYYKRCGNQPPFNASAAIADRQKVIASLERLVEQEGFQRLGAALDYRKTCVAAHPSTIRYSALRARLARLLSNR